MMKTVATILTRQQQILPVILLLPSRCCTQNRHFQYLSIFNPNQLRTSAAAAINSFRKCRYYCCCGCQGGTINRILPGIPTQQRSPIVTIYRSQVSRIIHTTQEQQQPKHKHILHPLNDGILRRGETPPISIKLNRDEKMQVSTISPTRTLTPQDIITLSNELARLFLNYTTKVNHRREDVWDALRTGKEYKHMLPSLEQLFHDDAESFYTVWDNVNVEDLFKLRLDGEAWINQTEIKKVDTYMTQNNLDDSNESKAMWKDIDQQVASMKMWNTIIIRILIHKIPRHVTARRLLTSDVTFDVIKVSTVHDELPEHYDERFNPYMGETNRVYGIYYKKPDDEACKKEPIVVLCVSLQPKIPRSLRDIFCRIPTTPSDISVTNNNNNYAAARNHVATLYSIVNVQHHQFSKLKLGEYLIHQAIGMLQEETTVPGTTDVKDKNQIDTFVTLSPIPGFGTWLLNEMDIYTMYCSPDFIDDDKGSGIMRKKQSLHCTIKYLAKQWSCREEDVIVQVAEMLYRRSDKERRINVTKKKRTKRIVLPGTGMAAALDSSTQLQAAVRYLLEGMAAHYIVHVKIGHTNGTTTMTPTSGNEHMKPSNGVARFHLQNGAQVFRINAFADLSVSGITESFGVMVNYRYDLTQLAYNQEHYERDYIIAVHEYVKQQLQ